jgi:peptidoglycan/xylan/chitin deacetylase (PgdA/CDA1 family)
MGFYWIKTHSIIKKLFSKYIWDLPNNENKIYLTFDDGPTPQITEWILEQLHQHNAKATFFCIGKNIEAFNHLNGWKTTKEEYCANISLCDDSISNLILEANNKKSKIFRPPYGKIKPKQAKEVLKQGYKIIMWDVLSADFDQTISREKCLKNVISKIKPGSIIVFHDSVKAFKNLEYALPKVLDYLDENNFIYETI